MSVFTKKEIEYMANQRLGRLATINPDGKPQVTPVGFRYNAELDAIDIGGKAINQTKKYRNIQTNPNVAFVIDDVLAPWQPRGIEIRGTAEAVPTGGKWLYGDRNPMGDALIRIKPSQVIGWGLEEGEEAPNNRKV